MKTESIKELKQEARGLKLSYASDSSAGYSRRRSGDHFVYYDKAGGEISDQDELKRIKSLAIPPAWEHVWICAKANGHLQATGIDTAGRKQYKYHPLWSKYRNDRKHNRMSQFGAVLPQIRAQIARDLEEKEFSRKKVVALAISIIDKTHIRVGNAIYAKLYGSFGLTSLRNKHIKIEGNKMTIAFKGKKGIEQEVVLTQRRLVNLLKKLKDIPGQELFQFYEADGTKKTLDSEAINEYIEACTGMDFTAKDFRTWWGTVTAARYMAGLAPHESSTQAHQNVLAALDDVAKRLGNTRNVCRKYYVHPLLLSHYEEGKLEKYLEQIRNPAKDSDILLNEEKVVMEFIQNECSET